MQHDPSIKDKTRPARAPAAPGVRIKVYVRDDMVGAGKIDLLRLVGVKGSIPAAAETMGVAGARADFLLSTLQRCFDAPLLEVSADGRAALTPLGEDLIRRHDAHLETVRAASADYLDWLEAHQRSAD